MKFDERSLLLYAVTDRQYLSGISLVTAVEQAITGGATMIQLRERELADQQFIQLAHTVKVITDHYRVPLIINDNLAVALAGDAAGLHVGQDDISATEGRSQLPADKIIGVSVQTVEQALAAEKAGADYLGVGAVFATSSKNDAQSVTVDTLRQICRAVEIPVVAIGGICENNVHLLKASGIKGIAVISTIFAKSNIKSAASQLYRAAHEMISDHTGS